MRFRHSLINFPFCKSLAILGYHKEDPTFFHGSININKLVRLSTWSTVPVEAPIASRSIVIIKSRK